MPISSLKHIPEEVRKEYYVLLQSANNLKKSLEILDIKRDEIIEKALKEINAEKGTLLAKLDKIERAMNILHPTEQSGYDKNASWKEKIIWILKESNQLLSVATIVGKLRMYDNNFKGKLNPIIRLTIRRMQEKGEIKKYEEDNPGTLHYGLPEWFINGELIMDYHYLM